MGYNNGALRIIFQTNNETNIFLKYLPLLVNDTSEQKWEYRKWAHQTMVIWPGKRRFGHLQVPSALSSLWKNPCLVHLFPLNSTSGSNLSDTKKNRPPVAPISLANKFGQSRHSSDRLRQDGAHPVQRHLMGLWGSKSVGGMTCKPICFQMSCYICYMFGNVPLENG